LSKRIWWQAERRNETVRRSVVILVLLATLTFTLVAFACSHQDGPAVSEGPYLGQERPGMTPELFAPDVITTEFHEHSSPVFSPDGAEVYWSVFLNFWGPQVILTMRLEDGRWTRPEVAPFSGQYSDGNPCFSPDGTRLFFESRRPVHAGAPYTGETDLWIVDRTDRGWGKPRHLGWTVNSDKWERGPCTSANGNLYFSSMRDGGYGRSDIYRAEWVDGAYAAPTNLGSVINTEGHESFPYIAPDESFIIYESASGDLFIHFRQPDDGWSEAINMAGKLESSGWRKGQRT
jgi:Tol biopolymer transport system component